MCSLQETTGSSLQSAEKKNFVVFFLRADRQAFGSTRAGGGQVDACGQQKITGRSTRSAEKKNFSFFFHAIDAVWTLLDVIGLMYFRSGQADVLDTGTTRKLTSKLISKCERIAARENRGAVASGRRVATWREQDVAVRAVCRRHLGAGRREPIAARAATRLCLEGASGCGWSRVSRLLVVVRTTVSCVSEDDVKP